jgi:hypothetical protein
MDSDIGNLESNRWNGVKSNLRDVCTQLGAKTRDRLKLVVIPAKAGIHLDLALLIQKQNGFPLSRE